MNTKKKNCFYFLEQHEYLHRKSYGITTKIKK